MITPEQYERHIDPEGGEATLVVEMKHSLWSADEETWLEQAPVALDHLRHMYHNQLHLKLSSRKEIRYGQVTVTGTSEAEDAPGDLLAVGRFEEHWDEIESLMDTLNIETTDDTYDLERQCLVECLPFADFSGTVGVYREFEVRATTVAELLRVIDAQEAELIADSAKCWAQLKALYSPNTPNR